MMAMVIVFVLKRVSNCDLNCGWFPDFCLRFRQYFNRFRRFLNSRNISQKGHSKIPTSRRTIDNGFWAKNDPRNFSKKLKKNSFEFRVRQSVDLFWRWIFQAFSSAVVLCVFIFMINLMYRIQFMNFIYVIHLMCWNYLIDLITRNRNRKIKTTALTETTKGGCLLYTSPSPRD